MTASDSDQRDKDTVKRRNGWLRRLWGGDDGPDIEPTAPPETPPGEVPELVPQREEPTPAQPCGPDVTPPQEPEIVPEREPGAPEPGAPDVPPQRPPELPPYPDRTPPEPAQPERTPAEPPQPPEIEPDIGPEIQQPDIGPEIPPPAGTAPEGADAYLTEEARSARWIARLRQGLSRSSAKLGSGGTFRGSPSGMPPATQRCNVSICSAESRRSLLKG